MEACTGWRYVAEELQRAGIEAHLAEPADTATARGRKKRAKTDRADARLMRDLMAGSRLPECWIPPPQILEYRALPETYHALRREHTAWVQRIHAVLFHQGAPVFGDLSRADAPREVAALARAHLSPAGQQQIGLYLRMLEVTAGEVDVLRRQLVSAAGRLRGARALAGQLYGVGPITALASCCWLGGAGRISSARKAVRFTGLDITVHSGDRKRFPGHYPQNLESSGKLKGSLAAGSGEFAELSAVSDCPVQLRLWDGELAAVSLGLGSAGLGAARVAEDPAREDDEALGGGLEVHIPPGLVEGVGECLCELVCFGFVGFEVQGGPDVWLVGRGALGSVLADLADRQGQVLQGRSDAEALCDEGAFDHEGLLPGPAGRADRGCLVSGWRSGATVAAAADTPRPCGERARVMVALLAGCPAAASSSAQ